MATYGVRITNRGHVARHVPHTTGLTKEKAEAIALWVMNYHEGNPHVTVEVVKEETTPDVIHLTELNKYFRAS